MTKVCWIFFLFFIALQALSQELDWYTETWKSNGKFVVDKEGYSTISGTYQHSDASVNGITLNSSNSQYYIFDIVTARYDPDGELLWAKTTTDAPFGGDQMLTDVTTDSEKSAIVLGYFYDSLTFQSTSLVTDGFADIFLAKYNSIGNIVWARSIGATGGDFAYQVKTDSYDNIYVSGIFDATFTMDGQTFTSYGYNTPFIAKFSPQGIVQWVQTFDCLYCSQGIAVSETGEVVVAGGFNYYIVLDGQTYNSYSAGINDQYFFKLDNSGNFEWLYMINQPGAQWGGEVILDAEGNSYIYSHWLDQIEFGGTVFPLNNKSEKFIKLDPNGQFEWFTEFLGDTSQCFLSLGRMTLTDQGLPCFVCSETEIIDSLNYTNYTTYGMTWVTFNPLDGSILEKKTYEKFQYQGNGISFDQNGAIYTKGGGLENITYKGNYIPPPAEGYYFVKIKGRKKVFEEDFLIYPNPSNQQFFLHFNAPDDNNRISLFDPKGKLVYENTVTADDLWDYTIEVNNWADGLYLGQITCTEGIQNFKVIVR